jgi:hypothetical protein
MTISSLTSTNHSAGALYAPRRFNKRSRQRFAANRTAELIRHLGREPSYVERIVIARIIAIEFWVRSIDAKLDRGEDLNGHDIRGRLAAENWLRLDLRELGLRPAAARAPTLSEVFAGPANEAAA